MINCQAVWNVRRISAESFFQTSYEYQISDICCEMSSDSKTIFGLLEDKFSELVYII